MKSIEDIAAFVAGHDKNGGVSVRGEWFNVQLTPDVAAGELLNVGVGFVDDSRRVHLRMARDLSRLRCLYDDRIDVGSFEELCDLIAQAYNGVPTSDFRLTSLTPHASQTMGRFASGTSISEILDRFYETTVTVGRGEQAAPTAHSRGRSKTITTEAAREMVLERLLERMGTRAAPYIARAPWVVRDNGREHKIAVPIRDPGRLCASVVSLWTKNEYRRKFQLAQAGLDLDTVQAQAPGERLGLFVMRPMAEQGYTQSELEQIDNEIDDAAWQLRKNANIELEQGEDAEELSGKIESWLDAA